MSECAHGDSSVSYSLITEVIILGEKFQLPINFVEDGGEPALLGREGFFDKFEITFNEEAKEVVLKRKKDVST